MEAVLAHYEMNATVFAEEIGVQRSSISHLLSGRNKPSLDFVMKVVQRFPEVNLYWLLFGKGSFPHRQPTAPEQPDLSQSTPGRQPLSGPGQIEKIVILFRDGSFREYLPS